MSGTAWLSTVVALVPTAIALAVLVVVLRRRDAERHRSAHQDPLTGLPNRALLAQEAARVLRTVGEGDGDGSHGPALLLIDLDGFKDVNDVLGHVAGDAVLVQVAAQMSASAEDGAMVARLGGDEFAVLMPGPLTAARAVMAAKTMLAGIGAADFRTRDVSLDVRASVGVALAPAHGRELGELLKHADAAMYESKRTRAGVTLYSSDLNPHAVDRLGTLALLRGAMDAGQMHLRYQPVVHAYDSRLLGFEALLRWDHPTRGLILPAEFVPMAERTSLIHPLTRWVLLTATREASAWHDRGLNASVAVNISAVTLEPGLLGIVDEALARSRLPADQLVLEVTETAITEDPEAAREVVLALRERGVSVSVDDFGAGFASLGLLDALPVHQLKIDRQFIYGLGHDKHDTMVASIIDLGHRLGLSVVAEGVETHLSAQHLRELGCDELQGYLIARPLPAQDVYAWAARHAEDAPVFGRAAADDASGAPV